MFTFNELLVISDGLEARLGVLDAGREWFKPWRTITGQDFYPPVGDPAVRPRVPELQVLPAGVFAPERLRSLLRDFIVFESDRSRLVKKVAGYHQFHAVQVAVTETLRAANLQRAVLEDSPGYLIRSQLGGQPGDRRVGVVWHTQGSGKSLTMAFYAGRVIHEPAMQNPTIVVLTDRNDLDDQLFGTFARCQDLLRQPPVQAESRAHLRQLLNVQAGGVVFTTIQKFLPEERGDRKPVLSARRNIVVIADESHRSQYDFIDGDARHMRDTLPNASFIAFTGAPLELTDRSTRAIFGDYISICFLAELRGLRRQNLAVELLQRLLQGEISRLRRKNLIQGRTFSEMVEGTLRRYQNRAIEAAQVIEEMIALANDMRAANARGEQLGLSEEELAFYDALETNDSAVKVLGDEALRAIARELVRTVRNNVSIDWTLRENVRAQLRVLIKRILRKYNYPPDKQEKATLTVLEQAALLTEEWAAVSSIPPL